MATRLRIGIVGAGTRGHAHLRTIKDFPDYFEFAGACDPRLSAAMELSKPYSPAHAYSNIFEFLRQTNPDVVVIASPPETHHIIAEIMARHGIALIIETPLGLTRRMMDSILETATKTGVPIEVGENMWRRPTERLNAQALQNKIVGRVLRVSSFYESAGHNSCYHTMSLLRRYVDSDVGEVRGFATTFALRGGTETRTEALIMYENGVQGNCTYIDNWIHPLRRGHPRFMSIEGDFGFIVAGDGNSDLLKRVTSSGAETYQKEIELIESREGQIPKRFFYQTDPVIAFHNPFSDRFLCDSGGTGANSDGIARADELVSIYKSVLEGSPPGYDLLSAYRDQEISITITESAEQNRALRSDHLAEATVWEDQHHELFSRTWGIDPFAQTESVLASVGLGSPRAKSGRDSS